MSLSSLQQNRLLHWARRLREISAGGEPLEQRAVDALVKLINECEPILNPPFRPVPGMHDKNGNTR